MTSTEPVLWALAPAVLLQAGAAAQQLAVDHTTAGIILAAGSFLTGLGGVLARSRVTPTG